VNLVDARRRQRLANVRAALVGALVRLTGTRLAAVNDECAAVAVLAAAPQHRLEGIDRLAGQLRDGQAAEQWADVQADRRVVSGAGGYLDIQDVEVTSMSPMRRVRTLFASANVRDQRQLSR
jgi:hypothetical protein